MRSRLSASSGANAIWTTFRLRRPTEGFYDPVSDRSGKRRTPNIVPTERSLPKIVGVRGLAPVGTRPKRLNFSHRKILQRRHPRLCVKTMLAVTVLPNGLPNIPVADVRVQPR
ncbi:hypothetical protein CA13_31810 [Planctomycetes bacterium CA13]|uniref:Uncharacterized protein n=1 Tax=Novipirellula herctigrandis TaxID=2527986 RepID=A0A5C5Z316_9BACT|nr:hypothetical protein CA13_31810 [Planctomycetes bacterium CA13]